MSTIPHGRGALGPSRNVGPAPPEGCATGGHVRLFCQLQGAGFLSLNVAVGQETVHSAGTRCPICTGGRVHGGQNDRIGSFLAAFEPVLVEAALNVGREQHLLEGGNFNQSRKLLDHRRTELAKQKTLDSQIALGAIAFSGSFCSSVRRQLAAISFARGT